MRVTIPHICHTFLNPYICSMKVKRRRYDNGGSIIKGMDTHKTSTEKKGSKEKLWDVFTSTGEQIDDSGSRVEYTISDVNKPNILGKQTARYKDVWTWYNPQGDITSHSKTSISGQGLKRERGYNINPETGKKERFGTGIFRSRPSSPSE